MLGVRHQDMQARAPGREHSVGGDHALSGLSPHQAPEIALEVWRRAMLPRKMNMPQAVRNPASTDSQRLAQALPPGPCSKLGRSQLSPFLSEPSCPLPHPLGPEVEPGNSGQVPATLYCLLPHGPRARRLLVPLRLCGSPIPLPLDLPTLNRDL